MQLYLPEDVHLAAKAVFTSLGLSQSTAASMMFKAAIDTRSVPFSLELYRRMNSVDFEIDRFYDASERDFKRALSEVAAGAKLSH